LLPAAPLGVPNAVAFAPLGYAVRFRLGSNAHAFLPIQKLTTHSATFSNIKTIRMALFYQGILLSEKNKNMLDPLIYDY
jgi:hypothetical protein